MRVVTEALDAHEEPYLCAYVAASDEFGNGPAAGITCSKSCR